MQFDFPKVRPTHPIEFSTDSLEEWSDMVSSQFTNLTMDEQPGCKFYGELSNKEIGQLQFNEVSAGGQIVSRSRNNIVHGLTDEIFLIYQLKGNSSAVINEQGHQIIRAGDALMISPQEPYTLIFEEPAEQICVQIPCDEIRDRLLDNIDVTSNRLIERNASISNILRESLNDLSRSFSAVEEVSSISVELFCDVVANCIKRMSVGSNISSDGKAHSQKFKELANFILTNYESDSLCAIDAANELGVSSRSLSRMCHENGTTFRQFLLRTRLNSAANSLKNTIQKPNCNITQVAYNSGFSDLSHFSKVFKTMYGVSPKEFIKS